MPFNSEKHHRRSIRLQEYDYSQPGSYFVTICTFGHKKLFGDIETINPERAGLEPDRTGWSLINNPEPTSEDFSKMYLNSFGKIVLYTWEDLVNHNTGIRLGEFVIMPNHVHGIIHIVDLETEWEDYIPSQFLYHDLRAGSEPARTGPAQTEPTPITNLIPTPLSEIIRQFKTFSARRINQARKTPGVPVWKRDYFEHIIRNEESYDHIVEYIQNNPMMWKMDKLFVD